MLGLSEHYILWSWAFIFMALTTALFLYREQWIPYLEHVLPKQAYERLHPSFEADVEAGLSSEAFDLSGNVEGADSRAGLDSKAKKEIKKIMKSRKVGFDEARRLFLQQKLAKNGVAPDGRPTDPKAVFFS